MHGVQIQDLMAREKAMQEHVVSIDNNSQAMFAEMQRMHSSLQASWQERRSLEGQVQTMQQHGGYTCWLAKAPLSPCLPPSLPKYCRLSSLPKSCVSLLMCLLPLLSTLPVFAQPQYLSLRE